MINLIRRNAVYVTILFALLVTIATISYTFWKFYQQNKDQYTETLFTKYEVINRILLDHFINKTTFAMLEANLVVNDLEMVASEKEAKHIFKQAKVLKQQNFRSINQALYFNQDGIMKEQKVSEMHATMIEYKGGIYFLIESPSTMTMVRDMKFKTYSSWPWILTFSAIIGILLLSFIAIMLRIRPLRRIRRKIAAFGAGNMNVSFAIKGRLDEIAVVANELDITRLKIRGLLESRTLFLRNIMHELKTPIAKGRIAAEMVDNEKQRERFVTIFERMEFLINEFALIEEVTSGSEHVDMKEYRLIDLIDGAIDLAMVDHDSVTNISDPQCKLTADFRLFSTAIKNMIDNAMKYSPDHKVRIGTAGKEIWFDSLGDPLPQPLSYYIEPFTKEHSSKSSFGLGLYLVDAILQQHHYVLAYEHRNGMNRFVFVPLPKKG